MGNVEKVKILFSNFFNRYTFKTAPSIIKTVGFEIYKVKLIHSITDQISAAAVIL
jgi:hypothetical protein